jgi:hypothetical protein
MSMSVSEDCSVSVVVVNFGFIDRERDFDLELDLDRIDDADLPNVEAFMLKNVQVVPAFLSRLRCSSLELYISIQDK